MDELKMEDHKAVIKRLIQVYITLVLQALILFICAGRVDITWAWVYIGVVFTQYTASGIIAAKYFPGLIKQRSKIQKGTKKWDFVFAALYVPMVFILPGIAGLDIGRFNWSGLSVTFKIAGLAGYTIAALIVTWALFHNKFFEGTVRIQEDRGHYVISTGPYGFVRHPGYTGIILFTISSPLIMGSLYGLIPAGIITLLFVIRTVLEDRTLRKELSGYPEYSKKVRFRLIPGLW